MNYISWATLHNDIASFSAEWAGKIDAVVGVPRSGCLVANLLGLHMNLPVSDIDSFVRLCSFWSNGPRMNRNAPNPNKGGRVLLLDDSALSGNSINSACMRLAGDATKPFKFGNYEVVPVVMYAQQSVGNIVNHHRVVNNPRMFAWNWPHHCFNKEAFWDFDGVICCDPTVAEDDEVGYVKAITNAVPLYLPTVEIGTVCTHRLEKRRPIVEAWMKRYNVKAKRLIMRQENTCYERRAKGDQNGLWKGNVFKASNAKLFVESCPKQARKIFEVSHKPVLCPAIDTMFR